MMTDLDLGQLRAALNSLCAERSSCIPWATLSSLGAINTERFQVTIDMLAVDVLGTPIVVVQALPSATTVLTRLSQRERDVAVLIARGLSNKAIARQLAISVATVKDHVHMILSKTGTSSRNRVAAMMHGDRAPL